MNHPRPDERSASPQGSMPEPLDGGAPSPAHKAPNVLLLMSPATYRAGAFLTAANRLGISAIAAVDHPADLPELSGALGIDLNHADRAIEQVMSFAGTHPVDAILSVDDSATLIAANANALLGLPHN